MRPSNLLSLISLFERSLSRSVFNGRPLQIELRLVPSVDFCLYVCC